MATIKRVSRATVRRFLPCPPAPAKWPVNTPKTTNRVGCFTAVFILYRKRMPAQQSQAAAPAPAFYNLHLCGPQKCYKKPSVFDENQFDHRPMPKPITVMLLRHKEPNTML